MSRRSKKLKEERTAASGEMLEMLTELAAVSTYRLGRYAAADGTPEPPFGGADGERSRTFWRLGVQDWLDEHDGGKAPDSDDGSGSPQPMTRKGAGLVVLSFVCPHCNQPLEDPREAAGTTFPCPSCSSSLTVLAAPPYLGLTTPMETPSRPTDNAPSPKGMRMPHEGPSTMNADAPTRLKSVGRFLLPLIAGIVGLYGIRQCIRHEEAATVKATAVEQFTMQKPLRDMVAKYGVNTNWMAAPNVIYSYQFEEAFEAVKSNAILLEISVRDIWLRDGQHFLLFSPWGGSVQGVASCSSSNVQRVVALGRGKPSIYAVFRPMKLMRVACELGVTDYDAYVDGTGDEAYAVLDSAEVGVGLAVGRYVIEGELLDLIPVVPSGGE